MSEESSPKKLSLVPHPRSTESTPIVPVLSSSAMTDPSLSVPQNSGTPNTSRTSTQQPLSHEDKLILYTALQDIANEIRRIDRERKKHH